MNRIEPSRALYEEGVIGVIPAKQGKSVYLKAGQILKLINTHGSQVVDTWAFNIADLREFMSMEHSRASMMKITPAVGDALVTNHRRPILTIVEDTSPGVHDTLIAACDRYRYEELGAGPHHENCSGNLSRALADLGCQIVGAPCPLNLFMNVNVNARGGHIEFLAPLSKAGQYVSLRAHIDQLVVMSACPQDLTPVNALRPAEVHFTVLSK
jgi:uncharacterized protein YcgI (DUF1989 family)